MHTSAGHVSANANAPLPPLPPQQTSPHQLGPVPPGMIRLANGQLVEERYVSPYASPHYAQIDPAYQAMNPYDHSAAQRHSWGGQSQQPLPQPTFEVHGDSADADRRAKLPEKPVEMEG